MNTPSPSKLSSRKPALLPAALVMPMLLALVFTPTAQAQLVSDGATAAVTTTINLGATNLVVGSNGPNTTLVITNGGFVTTTQNGFLGNNSTASTNNTLGVFGANSQLTITGGGSVLRIGNDSAFNKLLIAGGGFVFDGFGVIGFPVGASNNSVVVTNSGSVWSNSVLFVGEHGSGNSLTVTGGGVAGTATGTIGVDTDATNNTAVVTGSGSLWLVTGQLNVGDQGDGSLLRVASAGTVTTPTLEIGNQAASASNRLEVVGGNVNVTNSSSNAQLNVNRGTLELDSGTVTADTLLAANTAGKIIFNDGKLVTRTATINNSQAFVVGANPGSGTSGATFANTSAITIPVSGAINPASPYPSTINISSLAGTITKLTVTLSNFTHTTPQDVDFLLVGPDGGVVVLMAGAGGSSSVSGVTLTFDDASANLPPTPLATGTYFCFAPSNRSLPAPAPALPTGGGYSARLATFNGSNPNGAWSLYVAQDAGSAGQSGKLNGGWSLKIVTTTPAPTWDIRSKNVAATTVAGDLDIGGSGNNATLLVTNGVSLTTTSLNVSNNFNVGQNAGSSNNVAVIGPSSSAFIAGNQSIGAGGSFNTLLITNLSTVTNIEGASIGEGNFGDPTQGNNNQVIVTGGASWISSSGLTVGLDGSFNSLLISNGGQVTDSSGDIGAGDFEFTTDGANNVVTVTGANSLWNTSGEVDVGNQGPSSELFINNGGTVQAGSMFVGLHIGSGDEVSISSGTLTVTNSSASAPLNVLLGAVIFNGGNITADQFLLTNGGNCSFFFESGTLVTRTATINNGQDLLVGTSGSATWNVRSNAIPTTVANNLDIGSSAPNATLLITNGASLMTGLVADGDSSSVLGLNSTSSNNLAVIAGPHSSFSSANGFTVGSGSVFNTLLITNGGSMTNLDAFIGAAAGANNNQAIVTGSGSLWATGSSLQVGSGGSSNTLVITNSGQVASPGGASIGTASGANNNQVTVTGANSAWMNGAGGLQVGNSGSLNSLLITNGGQVTCAGAGIGALGGSQNNQATVTGANSVWTNSGGLVIGNDEPGNTLLIANGGRVSDTSGDIAENQSAHNCQVTVTDTNSVWANSGQLNVGDSGPNNTMIISNGATVADSIGTIGFNSSQATGNQVIVTGLNSLWTNSAAAQLGVNGGNNSLMIANSGQVVSLSASIGVNVNGRNCRATVTGASSLWNCGGEFDVGLSGAGSFLFITNGSTVQANRMFVGLNLNSTNNLLTVGGSTLAIGGVLDVRRGQLVFNDGNINANQLMLTNGGVFGGTFIFNAGDLDVTMAAVNNGLPFVVGDGTHEANYCMSGAGGLHSFANGLVITNNALLNGTGNVEGLLTVTSGGTISPGDNSIGTITLFSNPVLQGSAFMKIGKNGSIKTRDEIQVGGGSLAYGGSLTVSNVGPTTLALGDSFQIFSAPSYSGSFSTITLPTLPTGLTWSNSLLTTGAITVVTKTSPVLGAPTLSGTNLIFNVTGGVGGNPWSLLSSTNVALPVSSWFTNQTGSFDQSGDVTVTNGINFNEPQRFFLIYAP